MKNPIRNTAAVLCAAALAFSAAGCSAPAAQASAAPPEETVVPVSVQSPTTGDLAVKNEFIGRIMPDQSVSVYAKMSGEVTAAPFEVGDTVRAGQLLLQVDGDAVYAQVNQAKAAYESAKVSAETQLGTGYDSKLVQLEASMDAAESRYLNARNMVKDIKEAGGDDYGTNPSYRNARNEQAAALAAYDAAKAAYELAKNGAYDDAVKSSDAGLAQAEAAYKAAATSLDNLRVTAPISGIIEAKSFDVHDMASPQAPAYVISNKDVMTVTFSVPAGAVPAMTLGDTVDIDDNGTEYTGEIVEVSSIANEQSGLFPVKARIDGEISGLLSGVSVKVTASAKKAEGVLLVSVSAISYENGKPFIYKISPDNTAVRTAVETGISDDTLVEIVSGLSAADRIVTTWSPDLTDGAKLSVTGGESVPVSTQPASSAVEAPAEDAASSEAEVSSTAESTSKAEAAPQAPAAPKTVTSQTAPVSSAPAQAASSSVSEELAPAKDRDSLVQQAGEADPPSPRVPDELQAGDESEAE